MMTADPDRIRRQIEHTQRVLSADVNALAEKVNPRRAVARRTDRARQTLTTVKDSIMGTAEDAVSTVSGTATDAASTVTDTTKNAVSTVSDAAQSAASTVSDTASSVMSATANRISSMASSATDAVSCAPQAVRRRAQGNPLAAGLIAFGAGWLAASLIKSSRYERQLLEQAQDRLGERLEPMTEQAKQVATDVADNLRESAQQAFGSVTSAASEATSTVADHARTAATQLRDRTDEAAHNVASRGLADSGCSGAAG
jgi:gas vesicle protein